MNLTWKDLKRWIEEEKTKPRDYIIYVGKKTWDAALKDINHPYHYIIKNQINNGKKERRNQRKN